MTKKILVLTADAGFGHRAAANAIAAALEERYGESCRVAIVNPLDDRRVPAVLRRAQTDYDKHVLDNAELYQIGYRASDGAFSVSVVEQALIAMLGRPLQKIVGAQQPDAIVSTYPLYQAPVAAVFAITKHYVPLLTVVTDLVDVHTLWFNDEVDRCLVPTKQLQERALQCGMRRDSVEITGLPVNPLFARPFDRPALRGELGWSQDRAVVLCAGSKRVTRLEGVLHALNHSGLPLELALVSGGNEELFEKWRRTRWHQPAHVYGYVSEMYKMIQAADLIICKAGGLIISEALAAGLPLVLIEALAEWEQSNADFVIESGAGEMAPDPLAALACIFHWLEGDRSLLATRAANARRVGHPYAAYRVAELAWQAAQEGSLRREHRFLAQVPLLKQLLQGSRSTRRRRAAKELEPGQEKVSKGRQRGATSS